MKSEKALKRAETATVPAPNLDAYSEQVTKAIADVNPKFQYDWNTDQLYQDYKGTYMTEAQKAKNNVIASGKQLTGGYKDTYVDSAANQQYQNYLTEINRLAPAFENLAYAQQMMENDDAMKRAQMAAAMGETEYGRYRDLVGDNRNYRDYALGNYKYDVGLKNEKAALKNSLDTANKNYKLKLYSDKIQEAEAKKAAKSGGRSYGGWGRASGASTPSAEPTQAPEEQTTVDGGDYVKALRAACVANQPNVINAGRMGTPINAKGGNDSYTFAGLMQQIKDDFNNGVIDKQTMNAALAVIKEALARHYISRG